MAYTRYGLMPLYIGLEQYLKRISQQARLFLTLLAPFIWRKMGLRRRLRESFSRADIRLHSDIALTTADDTLSVPDHPISSAGGETERMYQNYLRKDIGTQLHHRCSITALSDARISYPSGVLGCRDGLITAAYPSASVLDNPKYAMPQAMLSFTRLQSSHPKGIMIYTCWAHNFYHWTLDILPRLALVDRLDRLHDTPLVMSEAAPQFAKTSLALAAPHREILWLPQGTHHFETLTVPTNPSPFNIVSHRAIAYLRSQYHPALQQALPPAFRGAKRIYVSRADATIRRISNEADIEARLVELGFRVIVMSSHTVAEQAELFAQAEWIISAHGAALVNLAFCASGANVIEVFQDGHKSRSYYTIAGLIRLNYGFMVGQKVGGDTAVDGDKLIRLAQDMGLEMP